jgi:lipopolysaccharide export system protein LptC
MAAAMASNETVTGRRFSYGGVGSGRPTRWARGRTGTRLSMSGGYNLFVSIMKVLLPAAAAVFIMLLLAWPELTPGKDGFDLDLSELAIDQPEGVTMLNARFSGLDSRNQPFLVTADVASQATETDSIVTLELPKADITLKDGTWVALSAQDGLYDRNEQTVDLVGQVSFFHDKGFELHTERARFDLDKGTAMSRETVTGQGVFGQIEATGFDSFEQGDRIIFSGPSRLLLYPDARIRAPAESGQ